MQEPATLTLADFRAYDLLSVPVWLFSVATLRILAANPAALDWLGHDAQSIRSLTITDVRPEEDRRAIVERVRSFDGVRADAGTWTIVARSGQRHAASITWSKVIHDGAEAILATLRDMTPVMQAREEAGLLAAEIDVLRQKTRLSRARLSRLFDTLPGKMLVLSPEDFRIVAVTDEFAQVAMQDRDAMLDRNLFDVFPDTPADPNADGLRNLRASLQRVIALRVSDVMGIQRYLIRGPDGQFQERFWLPRNKPVFDADGHLIYIIHRVEDETLPLQHAGLHPGRNPPQDSAGQDTLLRVAEARTALIALQEREARLRTAEMLLDLGSWEFDTERGQLSWSDRVYDIYGVPPGQGAPDFDAYVALVHPDDRADMQDNYRAFFEGGAPELVFQHRILRPDGRIVHVRGVGARHRVDGRETVIGFVQDVTDVRDADERLREAERLQKAAGYMARLGSWRVDLDQDRVRWSPETAAIHDEPPGTAPGLEDGINYYVPEHRDRIRTAFSACVAQGVPFDEILQIQTATGRRVWVRAMGEAVRNPAGRIVAIEGAFQDISDLVVAREVSDALAERLRHTLDNISDAFFLLDDDWCFSFLNSQAEILLQRNRDSLLGRSVWQEFPEAVGSTFEREYRQAVEQGRSVRFQEYYPPLSTWFEVSAHPTAEGLAVYFRDITRQRAQDQHLRLLESAVARQNDILLITEAEPIDGPDGPRIVYVNDAFERRTGYSRDEVIGKTPRLLQGPGTQRSELARIRNALQKWQSVRAELINYTKSGEPFWLELDIVPLADETGWFTHWVAIERDITKRKLAEQALKVNEERFRLIARATGNAVWEWDVAANTQWWSEGLREVFGHEPDPAEGVPTVWLSNIHPDDAARVDAAFDRLRFGQADLMQEEYRFRRADGTWAIVSDRAFVVRDEQGSVARILGCMNDISERLHLEDRLHQAQKMEAVGQLTGGVAHDFNNLLTIMLGNAETLSEELEDRPDLKKLADMIVVTADKGAELTNRLLAFSRKQPLRPQVMDVGRLIVEMEKLLRRTLPESIDIEVVCPSGLWQAEIDPSQLESALLNLTLNARDAMVDGGHLTIEMANVTLDAAYVSGEPDLAAGQYLLIAVSDTGHGIPSHLIGRVFEPFFTTKETGRGSGLGLSMVYGFVKQSGGHIRVYSELGEGTTFKLYFPRSQDAQGTGATETGAGRVAGGNETILVVEDDRFVRQNVVAQLKALGYRIFEAATGQEALGILARVRQVDLLFTDVVMPGGMGGRALADAARVMRPHLRVLFTSGYTENSIVHNGRLDQGVELLSKPYRRDQLARKVREVLDKG